MFVSQTYTKKKALELFENGLEFWFVWCYDWDKRIDSRKMGIQYVLEYILEMIESKIWYKKIDIYYWGVGVTYYLPKQKNQDYTYSAYEIEKPF